MKLEALSWLFNFLASLIIIEGMFIEKVSASDTYRDTWHPLS